MYREKKTCGIYRIEHKETGKSYVGLSIDIFKRWKEHSNFWQAKAKWSVIKQALHKHGLENFTFTILEECSKEELNDREIHWIKELDTQAPNGYNMTAGGGGCPDPSAEVRAKLSKAAKERIVTDKTKQILSLAHQGQISHQRKIVVINDKEYVSLTEAAKDLGFHFQRLSRYLKGDRKWPEGMSGYYK